MKPIFLTDEDKEAMLQEFSNKLTNIHLFDGSFSYTKKYYFDTKAAQIPKARILYTPMAYVKMIKLIQEFASEIAWHGLVVRGEDEGDFIVYDILTHEQTVTGSTVTTEDEQYARFMESLTDEQAENMFMQAHSHVNMATNPSSVDIAHQAKIVSLMSTRKTKKFQIFQIWNKQLKCTSMIYDFANNIYYEDKDIIVDILFDYKSDFLATNFVNDAKKLVTVRSYATQGKTGSSYNTGTAKKEEKKEEPAAEKKETSAPLSDNSRGYIPWWEREDLDDVDFDEEFFGRQQEYLKAAGYYD